MSVASSAASCISVVLDGRVMNLEEGFEEMMKGMRLLLNNLQRGVRDVIEEGPADAETFQERVEYVDVVCDEIDQLGRLVEGIPETAAEIQGKTPASCKEWYAARKLARKSKLASDKMFQKAADERAKARLAALREESKTSDAPPLLVVDGEVRTQSDALDHSVKSIEGLMNKMQFSMRQLAMVMDQQIEEEEDFKESVAHAEESTDLVSSLLGHLERLHALVVGTVGKVPPECRAWYANHKAERKARLDLEKVERKIATDRAKAELKLLLATEAKN